MNILLVSDTYEPHINGLVTSLNIHKKSLEKQGHKVYLLVPALRQYHESNIITLPTMPLSLQNSYKLSFPFSIKVFRKIKKLNIDVIHTHTPFSLGIYGIILGKVMHVPVVHTYHTYFEEYLHYVKMKNRVGRYLAKTFSRWYCQKMKHIIVPSNFIRELLIKYDIEKKIDVIPTGFNSNFFSGKIEFHWRKKLKIKPSSKMLLYVGRLEKEKNLYFLIDVFKQLLLKHDNIYLVFTGDGSEKNHLMSYIEKNKIQKWIKFTGFIQPRKLKDIYRTADLFVFPSLTETEGLVLLEAMINKLPVVSFYEKGTKTLLPHYKIPGIGSVKSNDEFKDEIELYLRDHYKQKEIHRNLSEHIKKFDEDIFIRKLIKVYDAYKRS